MTFRIIQHGDAWIVGKDSDNIKLTGGTPIDFEEYREFSADPSKAAEKFHLVGGKLVKRSKKS